MTDNGVEFTFNNNVIEGMEPGDPPLFVFDGMVLKAVNFDGYRIIKIRNKKEL
jgi:hypothetical protein